jgi:Ca-activated chloride channel family protein
MLAEQKRPPANLRVETNLVLVPITVCDPLNRPVAGFRRRAG